jgi:hypothetical protein
MTTLTAACAQPSTGETSRPTLWALLICDILGWGCGGYGGSKHNAILTLLFNERQLLTTL